MSDIFTRFHDGFYQETAKGRVKRNINRNLKAIGYSPYTKSIIVEDPETHEQYPIPINIVSTEATLDAIDRCARMNGVSIDKNDSRLRARAKLIYEKLLQQSLPLKKLSGTIDSKTAMAYMDSTAMKHIQIPIELLSRLKKNEFKAILDHEIEHSNQKRMAERNSGEKANMRGYNFMYRLTRGDIGGALSSPDLRVSSDATTEWIKKYLKTPAGQKLDKMHDRYLVELTADAAAIRKNGAAAYIQALKHMYAISTEVTRSAGIQMYKQTIAQKMDKNIKALNNLRLYLNTHDGEIDNDTLTKYIGMVESPISKVTSGFQQLTQQINELRNYAKAHSIPLKFGAIKDMITSLGSIEKIVSSYQNPFTTLNASRKDKLLKMSPSKRIQYIESVYQKCLDARKETVNIDKYVNKLNTAAAKSKQQLDARIEFARAIEKASPWTKAAVAEFVSLVPELFGIVFTEEFTMEDLAYNIMSDDMVHEMFDGYEDPFEDMIVEYAITTEQTAYDSEGGETPMSDFSRFHRPGFYQEEEDQLSDDKDITIGDLDLENDDDDQSPDELPGYLEGRMSDEDKNKFNETENMDPNDVELGSFGSDNSDVQNDYDQKDVDTLMKLMASEADALGEYLEAAKETNTDVLRRLYADIGDEERFHMEQLLFAKSELTGEKYVPKDPDVKKEYEELLAMGMDEETAMQTAVDKCHIRVSSDSDDDKSFEESINELEDNIKNLQETFELIDVTSGIILEAYESNKTSPYVTPIMECAFYQEAFGEADPKWDPSTSINPFKLLATLIGKGITLILKTVSSFRKIFNKLRNRTRYARAFLNDHGPGAIFQQGIHLYFEPQMARDGSAQLDPIVWKWFLCVGNLHDACIESLRGIAGLNIVNPQGHLMNTSSARVFFNDASVLQCRRSISAGIAIINKLDLIRTKVPVGHNDIERQTMFEYLTGYTDAKNSAGKSNNMFNNLYMISDLWKGMMVTIQGNLNVLSDQKNIVGSTYNKNVSKNDIAYNSLKTCVRTCQSFVKCLTSDMTEIARVCKKVYRNMAAEDNRDIETNYNGAGDLNNAYEDAAGPVRAAADQMKKNRWR